MIDGLWDWAWFLLILWVIKLAGTVLYWAYVMFLRRVDWSQYRGGEGRRFKTWAVVSGGSDGLGFAFAQVTLLK